MNADVGRRANRKRLLGPAVCLLLGLGLPTVRGAIVLEGPEVIERMEIRRAVVPKPKDAPTEERAAAEDPAYSDTLRFVNGDVLHGNLVAINGDQTVRWRIPDARGDIEFNQSRLARIAVPRAGKAPPGPTTAACLVRLTNGDELLGEWIALDADKLVLKTSYAGTMEFSRPCVASLRMVAAASHAIYEGPTGIEGWASPNSGNRGNWRYADRSLSCSRPGTLGSDLKLPELSRLEFDLAWSGQLTCMISVYVDVKDDDDNVGSYVVQLNPGYVHLRRVRRNNSTYLGQTQVQSLQAKSKTRVEILCNQDAKSLALLLDGELIKQWKDNAEWAGSGTGVLFNQQSASPLRISNIKVTPWDGKMGQPTASSEKTTVDTLELANHDRVSGTAQTLKEGRLAFATAFTSMEVPVDKIFSLALNGTRQEVAPRKPSDVKALFAGQGSVTFALEKYDGLQATGRSPNFGPVKFVAAAFKEFMFNLDQQPKGLEVGTPAGDDGPVIHSRIIIH